MPELQEFLSCNVTREIKRNGDSKRVENVNAFSNIDRSGLERGSNERMMLLYTTLRNEKIYIRYPGKETINSKPDKVRPWDFRPKAKRIDGTYIDDLAFLDIWSDLEHLHNRLSDENIAKLSALFYRAILMKDTSLVTQNCELVDIDVVNDEREIPNGTERLVWNKINLPRDIIEEINNIIGDIRGLSFEAYLYYNDLLCQNEDCKYYYKAVHVDHKTWNKTVGRKNTFLTHLLILAFLKNQVELIYLAEKFIRGKGVGPLDESKVSDLTNGLIVFD